MREAQEVTLACAEVEDRLLAEDYLLGRLADGDRDAFEAHYFECDRCLERLEAMRALRGVLLSEAAGTQGSPPAARAGTSRPWAWAGIAAGLAAVGLAAWRLTPPRLLPPPPPASAPTTAPLPPSRPSLADLGRFEAPRFEPAALRGRTGGAADGFGNAMRAYQAGDCEGALPGLQRAVQADPSAPEPLFFLGVCRLLTGRVTEGNESLRRTIAAGDSPYLEWAHFHLAKGLLLSNDAAGALVELERTIRMEGDLEDDARALAERVAAAAR